MLGDIVAETLLQMQMFSSLAGGETYGYVASWKEGNVSELSKKKKNIFASQTQILLPKRMFPSLATQGNMSGNNVSEQCFLV